MTIYYDQTESRAKTRLSPSILEMGEPVVGLEPATGADLLITIRDGLPGNVNSPPGSAQLEMFLEDSFLVQRKSGMDLLNSLDKLVNILIRMRAAGEKQRTRNWLLICGQLECSAAGKVILDGRSTGWQWASLQGALEAWQLLGGHISIQPDDRMCATVIERWNRNIGKWAEENSKSVTPRPEIPVLDFDPRPWRTTLMTFPGIGDVMSDKIAAHTERLCSALVWLSEPSSYGVRGVGETMLARCRQYLGLRDSEHLVIWQEQPTVHD